MITLIIVTGILCTTLLLKMDIYHPITSYIGSYTLLIITWTFCLLMWIDGKIKPAFIDIQIKEEKIMIRTFSPHFKKWESPFVLTGYNKRMKELVISREEYTDYTLQLKYLGLRKELKFQKTDSNGVYESANINISLLGQQKYTDLILAIDRLRTKICLN